MQLINLSNLNDTMVSSDLQKRLTRGEDAVPNNKLIDQGNLLEQNITMLKERYPERILFPIKEAAQILKVSYEFIRQRIITGEISSTTFGKRKLIHFHEIANLLTRGI